ncbi:MAG: hypothetical protein ACOCVH_02675 [Verrucomicrobiota bacterium]
MVKSYENDIYIGTVLMEKNRWLDGVRQPSFAVSDWVGRMADEGFDGIELWQNHAFLADDEEKEKLLCSPVPVRIFNSYNRCGKETRDERALAAEMVKFFSADGMKFNFGKDPSRHEEYCQTVKEWRDMLPDDFRFLCECHGGTSMEDPGKAVETFERLGADKYEVIIHAFGADGEGIRKRFGFYGDRITHIHANLSPGGILDEAAIRERIDLLRELGFCGSFTIEFTEGVGSEDENIETLFRNAARDASMLRKCLDS